MKYLLRILTIVIALGVALPCVAQSDEQITLTVSSDGPTKDEAIKNALRTAIEQAYGAFVSANTTILNDDLVKDEIVTISTGAIKEYSILSEVAKPDGNGYMVTTKATVSLPHLIKYAQNHGSECEFAGNTFGMQMKLKELRMKNEEKALENLITEVKSILPAMISWEMEMGEPREVHRWGGTSLSGFYEVPVKLYVTTFAYSDKNKKDKKGKKDKKKKDHGELSKENLKYLRKAGINIPEQYFQDREPAVSEFGELLSNSLEGIALTESEIEMYKRSNTYLEKVDNPKYKKGNLLYFTNRRAGNLIKQLYTAIGDICCDFVLVDNIGNRHDFHINEIRHRELNESFGRLQGSSYQGRVDGDIDNHSLSKNPFEINQIRSNYTSGAYYDILSHANNPWFECLFPGLFYTNERYEKRMPLFELVFRIPKDEIGKYSSFKVVRKE